MTNEHKIIPDPRLGSDQNLTWFKLRRDDLPDNPNIVFVFRGLVGFQCNPENAQVVVGAHGKGDVSQEGDFMHKLRVEVWKGLELNPIGGKDDIKGPEQSGKKIKVWPPGNSDHPEVLSLELNIEGSLTPGAQVLMHSGVQNRSHLSEMDHPKDFRWLIDLDDVYRTMLPKSGIYHSLLVLNHGIFYSSRLSAVEGKLRDINGSEEINLGRIAEYLAANIYIRPGGSAELKINREPPIPLFEAGQSGPTVVFFKNDCSHLDRIKCERYFRHRSDFHLNFRAFQLRQDDKIYDLVLDFQPGSDMAPCAAIGYGFSNSLN